MYPLILSLLLVAMDARSTPCHPVEEALDYISKNRANVEAALSKTGSHMSMSEFETLVKDGQIGWSKATQRFHWSNAQNHTQGNTLFRENFSDLILVGEKTIPKTVSAVEREKNVMEMFYDGLVKVDKSATNSDSLDFVKKSGAIKKFEYNPNSGDKVPLLDGIMQVYKSTRFEGSSQVAKMEIQFGSNSERASLVFLDKAGKVLTPVSEKGAGLHGGQIIELSSDQLLKIAVGVKKAARP